MVLSSCAGDDGTTDVAPSATPDEVLQRAVDNMLGLDSYRTTVVQSEPLPEVAAWVVDVDEIDRHRLLGVYDDTDCSPASDTSASPCGPVSEFIVADGSIYVRDCASEGQLCDDWAQYPTSPPLLAPVIGPQWVSPETPLVLAKLARGVTEVTEDDVSAGEDWIHLRGEVMVIDALLEAHADFPYYNTDDFILDEEKLDLVKEETRVIDVWISRADDLIYQMSLTLPDLERLEGPDRHVQITFSHFDEAGVKAPL
jgi:hypothetical protein